MRVLRRGIGEVPFLNQPRRGAPCARLILLCLDQASDLRPAFVGDISHTEASSPAQQGQHRGCALPPPQPLCDLRPVPCASRRATCVRLSALCRPLLEVAAAVVDVAQLAHTLHRVKPSRGGVVAVGSSRHGVGDGLLRKGTSWGYRRGGGHSLGA